MIETYILIWFVSGGWNVVSTSSAEFSSPERCAEAGNKLTTMKGEVRGITWTCVKK